MFDSCLPTKLACIPYCGNYNRMRNSLGTQREGFTMNEDHRSPEDMSLLENVRMIVGGVATIVAIVVPVILIRKLVRRIEEGETFKKIESHLY